MHAFFYKKVGVRYVLSCLLQLVLNIVLLTSFVSHTYFKFSTVGWYGTKEDRICGNNILTTKYNKLQ